MIDLPLMGGPPPKPTFSTPWIPPAGLVAGQLAHGLSWLLLALGNWGAGSLVSPMPYFPALAWVHLVGLGWITMIALSVLVHVIPAFFDVAWRHERVARFALVPYGLGVATLVLGFLLQAPAWLPWGGSLIGLGLLGFLVPATLTILAYQPPDGSAAPLRRGVLAVMGTLVVAATLGWILTTAFGWHWWPATLLVLPPIHAVLAVGGWLTMLIFGVSRNTVFPIVGLRHRVLPYHGAASGSFSAGILLLVLGMTALPGAPWILRAGALAAAVGVGLYLADIGSLLRAARSEHRPPIAFVAASLVYLGLAAVLGGGVVLGHAEWQAAALFVALAGWVGQSVNGYALHVGIRLLATMARGDQDHTRPSMLLSARLSWGAFAAFTVAVLGGTVALLLGQYAWLHGAGGAGLLGWGCYLWNVRTAWVRARQA